MNIANIFCDWTDARLRAFPKMDSSTKFVSGKEKTQAFDHDKDSAPVGPLIDEKSRSCLRKRGRRAAWARQNQQGDFCRVTGRIVAHNKEHFGPEQGLFHDQTALGLACAICGLLPPSRRSGRGRRGVAFSHKVSGQSLPDQPAGLLEPWRAMNDRGRGPRSSPGSTAQTEDHVNLSAGTGAADLPSLGHVRHADTRAKYLR